MVDYALVIEPDSMTESNLQDMMMARGLSSLNHADSEYLRFVPIGVSMETKRAGIDEDRAEVQVSTWIKAHFAKLKQLAPGSTRLPIGYLPALGRVEKTGVVGSREVQAVVYERDFGKQIYS